MSLSRRHFVHVASLSLLAGATLPAAFAQSTLGLKREPFSAENLDPLNGISLESFQPLMGQRFSISNAGQSLGSLTLVSISVGSGTATGKKSSTLVGRAPRVSQQSPTGFTLKFRGSGGMLAQGTYIFQNAAVGSLSIFIVPSGPGVAQPTYSAVFSFLN
ncbi:MAG: hypothetical protein WBQ94_30500 [Terracidiphilus sp.]